MRDPRDGPVRLGLVTTARDSREWSGSAEFTMILAGGTGAAWLVDVRVRTDGGCSPCREVVRDSLLVAAP